MEFKVGDKLRVKSNYNDEWFNVGDIIVVKDVCVSSLNCSGTSVNNYVGISLHIDSEYVEHINVPEEQEAVSVSEGGALRYNKGKPQFSHLSPDFITEMMKGMTAANEKYPYLNYTKKQDVRTASDSLMRHFLKFQQGKDLDEELETHHLALVAINAMIMYQNLMDYDEEVDNRYSKAKDEVQK